MDRTTRLLRLVHQAGEPGADADQISAGGFTSKDLIIAHENGFVIVEHFKNGTHRMRLTPKGEMRMHLGIRTYARWN